MGKVFNVAVVGCGEIAQVTHIPNLIIASHMFKVTALVDISRQTLDYCSAKFGITETFSSVPDMLASSVPVDVVFICTADQYHAEQAILCADAGKHVMLEKPMVQTLKEADAVEEARVRNSVVIFVGYMRRYATAFTRFKEAIAGKDIKYVRVRDIIGDNRFFTPQTGMYQKMFTDYPPEAVADLKKRTKDNLEENFGSKATDHPSNIGSWQILTAFSSHALSAMREAIGLPEKVLVASRHGDLLRPNWWQVLFDYGKFNALYEMAVDDVGFFDAHIEVYTGDSRIKITYDSPYIRALPIKMTIHKSLPNGDFSEENVRSTYVDFYNLALLEFYAAITEGKAFPTTVQDGKQDVILTKMIMNALVDTAQ
ncbi:hypothetical protein C362_01008 [Cryptococcus neoformans Bt1]|nr:hypothetical protein C362_01008 [Cryptococcus neoformans var. grubii Bt1]